MTSSTTINVQYPTEVLIENEKNNKAETLVKNIACFGLAMHCAEAIYVSNDEKHEVRQYVEGDKLGIVVGGDNGRGTGLHQFDTLRFLTVDNEGSVYVSDWRHHRVVKCKVKPYSWR